MDVKCLDTYALIEISKGNPVFVNYLTLECVVPDLILAEFYAVLLREHNQETADYWLRKMEDCGSMVERDILIKAVKYRHENRKQNLSFFDCVGYMFAKTKGMKFVTGDKEFKGLEGVEFVK